MLNYNGARSKLNRAKKHIIDFDRERLAFLETNPYVVVAKFDEKSNTTRSLMGPIPVIPDELALLAGDAVHNLRTALDHVAVELVRDAGFPTKMIYFPISETAEKYKAESPGKTKNMPVNAKKIIDQIAPYGGANNGLWALHTLDLTDKHRLLITIQTNIAKTAQLTLSSEPTEFAVLFEAPKLADGNIIGEVSGNSEANQRIKFTFDIALGEPEFLAGEPVVPTLNYLAEMVESIIVHFESLI